MTPACEAPSNIGAIRGTHQKKDLTSLQRLLPELCTLGLRGSPVEVSTNHGNSDLNYVKHMQVNEMI